MGPKSMVKLPATKRLVAGIVRARLSEDRASLIAECPLCHDALTVEVRADGSFGNLVACLRCKEIFKVEVQNVPTYDRGRPRGFGIYYQVEGAWNVPAIMEGLFDTLGAINQVDDGFVCVPDELHENYPLITVNEMARTIRLGVFGKFLEREAASIINQAVEDLVERFRLDLRPVLLERWEYVEAQGGYNLVERRPLGKVRTPAAAIA